MIPRPSTILAIDDTPANLMTLGAALQGEFELQIATSGLSGIELALQSLPDLILLDVMMPEVDGFETFRRLAAQPTLKDIPVIFVTALDNFESEVTGLSLGAADYITKPVNVVIARQRIRNLLERERLRKEVQMQAEHLRKLVVAVEQSPASIVITNLDASLEYVNPRFTEVTGYSAAEVLGQNPRILQSGITPKDTYLNMWDTLTHGRPWKGELINRRKSGELYWEEAQIAPVKDATGTVTHYVAVKTDISARKQLESQNEEALSRLQKIASRVPGVVYQYLLRADGSSCFPFASEAIREIYRVAPEEVREDASKVFAILHPDDIAELASSIERSARDNDPLGA
jgi:PAS domain S-box-containing protein